METPSRPAGAAAPTSAAKVGRKSQDAPTKFEVCPALILPGQAAMHGTRMPPSQSCVFIPRRGLLPSKNSRSYPPLKVAPLSEVKMMSVFSAWPVSFSSARLSTLGILADKRMAGVFPGEESASGRRADCMARVKLREADAVCCKLIEIGRLDLLLAVAAEFAVAEIVGEEEDDIRLSGFRGGRDGGELRCDEDREDEGWFHVSGATRGRMSRTSTTANAAAMAQMVKISAGCAPASRMAPTFFTANPPTVMLAIFIRP